MFVIFVEFCIVFIFKLFGLYMVYINEIAVNLFNTTNFYSKSTNSKLLKQIAHSRHYADIFVT